MPIRRWVVLFVVLVIPLVAGFALVSRLPDPHILKNHYPRVRYKPLEDGRLDIDVDFSNKRPAGWTELSAIPGWVQGAVVTSEDWAFFQHEGFDFNQIRESVEDSVDKGRKLRGASTLSQQLVKNLFLSQDRSWFRKAAEAWLTHRLEAQFTKKQILEFYLNIVEWGPDVVGIRKAAQNYFGKPPSALNPREAAYLAYLIPSPRRYSRGFYKGELSAFAHRQIQRNLERMKQAGYITEVQYETFARQRLPFEKNFGPQMGEELEGYDEEMTDAESLEGAEAPVHENAPAETPAAPGENTLDLEPAPVLQEEAAPSDEAPSSL
jgi:monofunctional biosynthetic peptidoglycan transglycosylase